MVMWQVWLIIAGFCFILEIITVGFLVFWLAIAAIITAILSLFIKSIIVQTAIFVILSACLILLTRKFVNRIGKNDNTITNVNSIIGKEALVIKEINPLSGSHGKVKVNGDLWSAICSSEETIEVGSKVKILKIDGVKLIVEPIKFCQKETV